MAVLQYIGARYVPKFYEGSDGSKWDQGVSYEPLTIVIYLGSSWTSKKAVPSSVGAPNLNPEYWANTGNFNEQVETLTNLVTDVQADLTVLTESVEEAQADIEELKAAGFPKLSKDVSANFLGIYDSFTTQLGAVVKYGNTLWTIDGVSVVSGTTQLSNVGKIRKWDFSTGDLVNTYTVETGHANSAAYCPETNCLYIAPTWDYTASGRPLAGYIYKVNCNTYLAEKVATGAVNALGLSYDHVNGQMYLLGYDGILYKYDVSNDTISAYVDFSAVGLNQISGAALQDIAVYDHTLLWTTSRNILAVYSFADESAKLIDMFNVAETDSNNYFHMKEIEGFEFDETGHLVSGFTTSSGENQAGTSHDTDSYTYRNTTNFITEIPTNIRVPFNKGLPFAEPIVNATYTVTFDFNNFKLSSNSQLKTMEQSKVLVQPPHNLSMGANYNMVGHPQTWRFYDDVIIDFNGKTLTGLQEIVIYGSKLTITGIGTIALRSGYNTFVNVQRGDLLLTAQANLTLTGMKTGNNNFINPGLRSEEVVDFAQVSGDADPYTGSVARTRYRISRGDRTIYQGS